MMLDHYEEFGPLHATAEWMAEMRAKGIQLCERDNGNGWACLHPLPCPAHPPTAIGVDFAKRRDMKGTQLPREKVCMADDSRGHWTPQGYEVFQEPCLHPLPCPRHPSEPQVSPE